MLNTRSDCRLDVIRASGSIVPRSILVNKLNLRRYCRGRSPNRAGEEAFAVMDVCRRCDVVDADTVLVPMVIDGILFAPASI
jgi:hypothetical protein